MTAYCPDQIATHLIECHPRELQPLQSNCFSISADLYEWGWGQSFHFSPKLPGKGWPASEAAHEARLAAILHLEPGKKCLDVGCGVGGPMRTIASTSGAEVTGITINAYQVQRAHHHNSRVRQSILTRELTMLAPAINFGSPDCRKCKRKAGRWPISEGWCEVDLKCVLADVRATTGQLASSGNMPVTHMYCGFADEGGQPVQPSAG